jgi:hypothetical protein
MIVVVRACRESPNIITDVRSRRKLRGAVTQVLHTYRDKDVGTARPEATELSALVPP